MADAVDKARAGIAEKNARIARLEEALMQIREISGNPENNGKAIAEIYYIAAMARS